jgi:hypothetical protein
MPDLLRIPHDVHPRTDYRTYHTSGIEAGLALGTCPGHPAYQSCLRWAEFLCTETGALSAAKHFRFLL